jgi:hypothetical protein
MSEYFMVREKVVRGECTIVKEFTVIAAAARENAGAEEEAAPSKTGLVNPSTELTCACVCKKNVKMVTGSNPRGTNNQQKHNTNLSRLP